MTTNPQTVAVLGASAKPDRFSFKALQLLRQHGHTVIPIHPTLETIGDVPVISALQRIDQVVDTLTIYVNPAVTSGLVDKIVALNPGRVIFNPGTESPELLNALEANGIAYQKACTLVLLNTGQF